jgi:CBS domain-containing protein
MRTGERESSSSREAWSVAIALAVLVVGLVVLWLAHRAHLDGGAVAVLLFLPVLAYGLASGKIQELTGPGGFGVKLARAANRPPPIGQEVEVPVDQALELRAQGTGEVEKWLERFDSARPSVLKVDIGRGEDYCRRDEMVELLSAAAPRLPKLRFAIFLYADRRVVGYMPLSAFAQTLADPVRGEDLAKAVNRGDEQALLATDGMQRPSISSDATNREVLEELDRTNADCAVVVDGEGRFRGVVERERIMSRMMLALVK